MPTGLHMAPDYKVDIRLLRSVPLTFCVLFLFFHVTSQWNNKVFFFLQVLINIQWVYLTIIPRVHVG